MKFKVGQKVKVSSDLVVNEWYGGIIWYDYMAKYLSGKTFTISAITILGNYILSETHFILSEEMLEPVETFNVGDVVYDLYGDKAKIVDIKPCYLLEGYGYYVTEEQIKKVKPLKKITKEQLAEMGYEVEE